MTKNRHFLVIFLLIMAVLALWIPFKMLRDLRPSNEIAEHYQEIINNVEQVNEPGMLGYKYTRTNPDGSQETWGVGLGYSPLIDESIDTLPLK